MAEARRHWARVLFSLNSSSSSNIDASNAPASPFANHGKEKQVALRITSPAPAKCQIIGKRQGALSLSDYADFQRYRWLVQILEYKFPKSRGRACYPFRREARVRAASMVTESTLRLVHSLPGHETADRIGGLQTRATTAPLKPESYRRKTIHGSYS